MLKYCRDKWYENKDKLEKALRDSNTMNECEYLLTFVNYGSCSVCDTLQSIQGWGEKKLTDSQVKDFMSLCKDLLCNMVKPYNSGWRSDEKYREVAEDKV